MSERRFKAVAFDPLDDCIPHDLERARRNACTLSVLACRLYLALHERTEA